MITGVIALAAYLLVADALLALVPAGELGAIQGVMQAVHRGAAAAGASWLVAPIAIVMAIAIGGAASAWFAGPARIPFVAGLDRALPAALGRVHPRWGSPHVALHHVRASFRRRSPRCRCRLERSRGVPGAAAGGGRDQPGAVRLHLPALMTLDSATRFERLAGAVGAARHRRRDGRRVPADRETWRDVWVFELKMAAGVGIPILVGLWMYWKSRPRPGVRPV